MEVNPQTFISIIIPVYNTRQYLEQMLGSICMSVPEDNPRIKIEIICVDDGSTDGSLDLLNELARKDRRIRIYSQQNQGQSVARNTGIDHITKNPPLDAENKDNHWVYFFDSDDVLHTESGFEDFCALTNNRQSDLVMFSGNVIDEEGHHMQNDRYQRPESLLVQDRPMAGTEVMSLLLKEFRFRAVPWLYLARYSVLKETGIRFRPGIIHEDELFTATLLLSCKNVVAKNINLVWHRMRQSSTMGATFSRRNMDCYLTVIDGMQEFMQAHPDLRRSIWDYCRYTLTHVLITARCLPLRDRWHTLRRIVNSGYLPYVEFKRLIQFIIGNGKSS